MMDTQEPRSSSTDKVERLCDFLKAKRESKHITLEKIARDTRLNLEYLYAMEQGDYQVLPAEAYVRIYLRSVAKYLQIDTDEVVRRYNEEFAATNVTEEKRSTRSIKTLSHQRKIKPFSIIVGVVFLIIVVSFLRTGRREEEPKLSPAKTDSIFEKEEGEKGEEKIRWEDTVGLERGGIETGKTDSFLVAPKEPSSRNNLLLTIRCERDSSWVKVYRDSGRPWRQILHTGDVRSFQAVKHFHVALGNALSVSAFFNYKKLRLRGSGVLRFSLDRSGVKWLNRDKWQRIFPNARNVDSSGE